MEGLSLRLYITMLFPPFQGPNGVTAFLDAFVLVSLLGYSRR